MIASVFRTVGIVPGGLGTFEATSVWTLHMLGVSVPVGLAATLLFRGLSFWLPMLPGWWVSRQLTASTVAATLPEDPPEAYWSADADTLVQQLGSAQDGLSTADAAGRLRDTDETRCASTAASLARGCWRISSGTRCCWC